MASVIIPVFLSFFLGPGVGQLYNREYKKGAILIVLSFVALFGAGVWYFKAIQPFLPADMSSVDPQALQVLLKNAAHEVAAKKGYILSLSQAGLMVLWLYGVVDAYKVAIKKKEIPNGRV